MTKSNKIEPLTLKEVLEKHKTANKVLTKNGYSVSGYYTDTEYKREGYWEITKKNTLDYIDKFGRQVYSIDKTDMKEDDWLYHLSGKLSFDWNDFMPNYIEYLRNNNVKSLPIRISY